MTQEELSRIRQLFEQALEKAPESRADFLRQEAAGEPQILDEVLALLRSHDNAGSFLAQSPGFPASITLPAPAAEPLHTRIGPYRLLRELGRGGMGEVYLAVRDDDTFRKMVALKVIRNDRASEEEVRRFRQERQVMAGFDHPNVARILDGGCTPDNKLFYVMEYVSGQPIDQFAHRSRLKLPERLRLFQQVCLAVNHLHESLIIHRDIKPSNILVTQEGVVKLLDFGIAKITRPGQPGETLELHSAPLRMMTVAYASPEQMKGEPVTRQSDIYSLGVLLYELLTGNRPFDDSDGGASKFAALVSGVEVPRPSKSLASGWGFENPRRWRRLLEGDLDSILLKALHNAPARRYQSALEFSQDLARLLDGLPILARPAPPTVRVWKFVRRHRVAVAAALALAFLSGTGSWQAVEARIQRERAETKEAELARLLNLLSVRLNSWAPPPGEQSLSGEEKLADVRLLDKWFREDFPRLLAAGPQSTGERLRLVQSAVTYLARAQKLSRDDPRLQTEIGKAFESIAQVQYVPFAPSLGDRNNAISSYQLARSIYREIASDNTSAHLANRVDEALAALGVKLESEPRRSVPKPVQAVQQRASVGVGSPRLARLAPTAPVAGPREPDGLADRIRNTIALVAAAESTAEPVRRDLETKGMSLNASVVRDLEACRLFLEDGKTKFDSGDYARAGTSLEKAEAYVRRVPKYFGR